MGITMPTIDYDAFKRLEARLAAPYDPEVIRLAREAMTKPSVGPFKASRTSIKQTLKLSRQAMLVNQVLGRKVSGWFYVHLVSNWAKVWVGCAGCGHRGTCFGHWIWIFHPLETEFSVRASDFCHWRETGYCVCYLLLLWYTLRSTLCCRLKPVQCMTRAWLSGRPAWQCLLLQYFYLSLWHRRRLLEITMGRPPLLFFSLPLYPSLPPARLASFPSLFLSPFLFLHFTPCLFLVRSPAPKQFLVHLRLKVSVNRFVFIVVWVI